MLFLERAIVVTEKLRRKTTFAYLTFQDGLIHLGKRTEVAEGKIGSLSRCNAICIVCALLLGSEIS